MTTLNSSPKAAKRQKQIAARERKLAQAEKMRAKKAARGKDADAFIDTLERWMMRDPPVAFTDVCPACRGDIFVTYEHGRMQHGHAAPVCDGYRGFEQIMGNESPPLETWAQREPTSLPAWASGPHTELTTEQGVALMDEGDFDNSTMVMRELPDGSSQWTMIARNMDGLYWWPMETLPSLDDEDDEV
jgi:hypothetical protein